MATVHSGTKVVMVSERVGKRSGYQKMIWGENGTEFTPKALKPGHRCMRSHSMSFSQENPGRKRWSRVSTDASETIVSMLMHSGPYMMLESRRVGNRRQLAPVALITGEFHATGVCQTSTSSLAEEGRRISNMARSRFLGDLTPAYHSTDELFPKWKNL